MAVKQIQADGETEKLDKMRDGETERCKEMKINEYCEGIETEKWTIRDRKNR